jgi:hypothetical protein
MLKVFILTFWLVLVSVVYFGIILPKGISIDNTYINVASLLGLPLVISVLWLGYVAVLKEPFKKAVALFKSKVL